jgi:lipoprotein signal peptidase
MNLADLAITAGVAVVILGTLVAAWRTRGGRPLPSRV